MRHAILCFRLLEATFAPRVANTNRFLQETESTIVLLAKAHVILCFIPTLQSMPLTSERNASHMLWLIELRITTAIIKTYILNTNQEGELDLQYTISLRTRCG
jgi:hypothetical protein